MICPNCKKVVSETSNFCIFCGYELGKQNFQIPPDNHCQKVDIKLESTNVPQRQENISGILEFYRMEFPAPKVGKTILETEDSFWQDEKNLPSLLKKGVFLIVGVWEGCEIFDRLVAYKISSELDKKGIGSLVLTDRYWKEVKDKFGYDESAVITIGGPVSNSMSNEVAEKCSIGKNGTFIGITTINEQLICCLWGRDARSTLIAGKLFIESHLDSFLQELR